MTKGRQRGSTNKDEAHKAGGARMGAGRPRKQKDAPNMRGLQQQPLNTFRVAPVPDAPLPAHQDDEATVNVNEEAGPTDAEQEEVGRAAREEQERAARERKEADAQRREEIRQKMLTKLREGHADGSLDSVLECFSGTDEESDDEEEEVTTGGTSGRPTQKSSAYKPPEGSTLHTMLKTIKYQVKSDNRFPSAAFDAVHKRG